jgi:hypothetical protein
MIVMFMASMAMAIPPQENEVTGERLYEMVWAKRD